MSSLYSNKQSRQEQFLAQIANLAMLKVNSIMSFFDAHLPLRHNWCAKSSCVSLSRKTLKV
ncbi:hypothetical protein I79_014865 [Cricetulus griseus]|uniref:Uncharacterized protein n=1 Tax=Cricetulus griseus TaxID=10029 RepID=G3HV87_CRIGR|nr:hypothetical protein I79_014865 [Cricetulus griseus]